MTEKSDTVPEIYRESGESSTDNSDEASETDGGEASETVPGIYREEQSNDSHAEAEIPSAQQEETQAASHASSNHFEVGQRDRGLPGRQIKNIQSASCADSAEPTTAGLGEPRWVVETESDIHSVAAAGGTVYVGCADHCLYALDVTSGEQRWTFETEGVVSSLAIVGDTAYFGSRDSNLYALNTKSGSEQWRFGTNGKITCSPVVTGDTVYVGNNSGHLYAVNEATGEKQWAYKVGECIESPPVVVGDIICAGSPGGDLHGLDSDTGTKRWVFSDTSVVPPLAVAANGTIYISEEFHLGAIDAASGTKQWAWTHNFGEIKLSSAPSVADGSVYVGFQDGYLASVDMATGTKQWIFETEREISFSPTVADKTVYVGSADGKLYAVDAISGEQQWTFTIDSRPRSSPVVADGIVYLGSQSKIHAISVEQRNLPISASGTDQTADSTNTQPEVPEGKQRDLIEVIQSIHEIENHIPKTSDLPEYSRFDRNSWQPEFKSWDEALIKAEINVKQGLLDEISRLAAELDRVPSITDMDLYGEYSGQRYAVHFRSWKAAVEQTDLPESRTVDCTTAPLSDSGGSSVESSRQIQTSEDSSTANGSAVSTGDDLAESDDPAENDDLVDELIDDMDL